MSTAARRSGTDHRPLSFRLNVLWTFLGNVTYSVCQWAMLVSLARIGGPTTVGEYALAVALTTPLMMFADMQLRGILATDATREYTFGTYLALRVVTTILALTTIVFIALFLSGGGHAYGMIVVLGIGKSFDAVSNIVFGLFQQRERLDWVSRAMILNGVFSFVAFVGGMAISGSGVGAVLGSSLVSGVVLFLHNVPLAKSLLREEMENTRTGPSARPSPTSIGKLVALASPMGVVLLLGSLNTNIPRYFLEHFVGTHDLGVYAAIAALLVAGNTVTSALGQAASPRLARFYVNGDMDAFVNMLRVLVGLGALIGTGAIVVALIVGEAILTLIYGYQYADYSHLLTLVMIAGCLSYAGNFLGVAVTSMRKFKVQVPIHLAKLLTSSVVGFLLIKGHGLLGAAWVLIITTALGVSAFTILILCETRKAKLTHTATSKAAWTDID